MELTDDEILRECLKGRSETEFTSKRLANLGRYWSRRDAPLKAALLYEAAARAAAASGDADAAEVSNRHRCWASVLFAYAGMFDRARPLLLSVASDEESQPSVGLRGHDVESVFAVLLRQRYLERDVPGFVNMFSRAVHRCAEKCTFAWTSAGLQRDLLEWSVDLELPEHFAFVEKRFLHMQSGSRAAKSFAKKLRERLVPTSQVERDLLDQLTARGENVLECEPMRDKTKARLEGLRDLKVALEQRLAIPEPVQTLTRGLFLSLSDDELRLLRRAKEGRQRRDHLLQLEETLSPAFLRDTDKSWKLVSRCLDSLQHGGINDRREIFYAKYLDRTQSTVMRLVQKELLPEIVEFLDSVDEDAFRSAFRDSWGRQPVTDVMRWDYAWHWFLKIRDFLRETEKSGRHVVFSATNC